MNNPLANGHKIKVGILFGGKSAEHEVSIRSAQNVLAALDRDKFEPVLIGIDKQGGWHLQDTEQAPLPASSDHLTLLPGNLKCQLVHLSDRAPEAVDVIFPVLHGPMGEDGTIQGFLDLANLPYVGPGVLGSALGMDKDVMKRLVREAGIPVAKLVVVHQRDRAELDTAEIVAQLGLPLFVKPANMGSSVGVSKVEQEAQLGPALDQALSYDRKALVEAAIMGDEVECAILGNERPRASLPGRIKPRNDFYSYEAKYLDDEGATLEIPAQLPEAVTRQIQAVSLRAFQVLECEGMARVDLFVTPAGEVIFNEVNTIPGFTQVSMYPKLWEASGLEYKELITELITLALERFEARQQLRSSYLLDEPDGLE